MVSPMYQEVNTDCWITLHQLCPFSLALDIEGCALGSRGRACSRNPGFLFLSSVASWPAEAATLGLGLAFLFFKGAWGGGSLGKNHALG